MTYHGYIGHHHHHGHHHGHHHRNTNIIVTTPFTEYGMFSYFRPSYYIEGPGSVLQLIISIVFFLIFLGMSIGLSVYFTKIKPHEHFKNNDDDKKNSK